MSMETPKISVGMIAEQFSAMSVKSRQWYEKSLREAVLYSLVIYYEARLKSRFVPVLDPWEGMTVANYNYRLVLAEVERKLPMWVSNLPTESENASVLYAELLGKAERRRTLRRRYRSVWWFELRKRAKLRRRIARIDAEQINLSDFLNMAWYLYRLHHLGEKEDFGKIFA